MQKYKAVPIPNKLAFVGVLLTGTLLEYGKRFSICTKALPKASNLGCNDAKVSAFISPRLGINCGRGPKIWAAMTYNCVASLVLSIVSRRKRSSPQAMMFSTYFITTFFMYETGLPRAIKCGLNGFSRHSAILSVSAFVASLLAKRRKNFSMFSFASILNGGTCQNCVLLSSGLSVVIGLKM